LDILRESANLRAGENLKTPDAIHATTATASNCQYLLTNDAAFKRVQNLDVVVLSDLI
jgi:predicted nucleic acid-binding protein